MPNTKRDEIARLWLAGMPRKQIATRLGVSLDTIRRVRVERGLPQRVSGRRAEEDRAAWRDWSAGRRAAMPACEDALVEDGGSVYRCSRCGRTFARWEGVKRNRLPVSIPTMLGGAPVCRNCIREKETLRRRLASPYGLAPDAIR